MVRRLLLFFLSTFFTPLVSLAQIPLKNKTESELSRVVAPFKELKIFLQPAAASAASMEKAALAIRKINGIHSCTADFAEKSFLIEHNQQMARGFETGIRNALVANDLKGVRKIYVDTSSDTPALKRSTHYSIHSTDSSSNRALIQSIEDKIHWLKTHPSNDPEKLRKLEAELQRHNQAKP